MRGSLLPLLELHSHSDHSAFLALNFGPSDVTCPPYVWPPGKILDLLSSYMRATFCWISSDSYQTYRFSRENCTESFEPFAIELHCLHQNVLDQEVHLLEANHMTQHIDSKCRVATAYCQHINPFVYICSDKRCAIEGILV